MNILNGANGITDPVVFEPGDGWVPTASAVTKDAGAAFERQSSRDLLGNPRVSGAAIDVGCYEADDDVFDCSFSVTPIQSLSNGHVEFLARITGLEDDSDLAYVWTIVNKTTGETLEESGKLVSFDAMDEGWYGATVQVFEGGEEIAGYSIDDCLQIFPAQIVLEAGDDVAAAVERGALAGNDLSLRPSRIVAVGDSSFILNAQLAANASANRDFFHNCVAYLAGVDMAAGSGLEPGVLYSGLDREGRMRFLVVAAGAVPIAVFLLLALGIAGRRRRG